MADPIVTDYRRDLVARTAFDVLKIVVAAAFASRFFFEFAAVVKWVIGLLIVALAVGGFIAAPQRKP